MRPFTLTTGVLLLVASSLAAPLHPRSPNAQGGPELPSTGAPYEDTAGLEATYDSLGKSYAATAHSWISWPFKRSLKAREEPSNSNEPYTDEASEGLGPTYDSLGKSYAATAHSWISWPFKRSLKARQEASTSNEPYTDEASEGLEATYDSLGKSYAATAHSWISWPGKRSLKVRQSLTGDPIAGTLVNSTSVIPKSRYPGNAPKNPSFASRMGWVRYDGRMRQ